MKSFLIVYALLCLFVVSLAYKQKHKNNNLRQQAVLKEKVTSICAKPFYLFNVATGGYLQATAGQPASLSSSPLTMFCLQNVQSGNLLTSDGKLALLQQSGSNVLSFGKPGSSAPSFITRVDANYHFEFVITTGMCGVYLATVGWDQSSQIDLAGCAADDSRQLWFVENSDGSIRHTIS